MAAITLAKTWQFNINQLLKTTGVQATDFRQLMLAMVNSLLTFGVHPWTVVGSSDSSTAGLDAVNRWAGNSNLVWVNANGSAHSWIVLKNTTGLGTYQLLISLLGSSAAGANWRICCSPGGNYTAGSASNDPTATDEVVISTTTWTDTNVGSSVGKRIALHAMQSTDGQCTRIFHMASFGAVNGFVQIEKLSDCPATVPVAALAIGGGGHQITWGNFVTSTLNYRLGASAITAQGTGACEGSSSSPIANNTTSLLNFASDFDDTWLIEALAFVTTTRGLLGLQGSFQDLWIATVQLATGQLFGTSKKAVSLSPLVLPWDGASNMLLGG